MFSLSKIDKLNVSAAVIKQMSPIEQIEVSVEHKIVAKNEKQQFDREGALKLDEDLIGAHITRFF